MNKKNLILCFSSIRPKDFTSEALNQREKNYDLSLTWLLKSLPNNWDILYNDNTLDSFEEIKNENLKNKIKKINFILHKNNNGVENKGAGEHDMCKSSFANINPEEYNWVVYFTARHIIPNSWFFDNLEQKYNDYDSVMSNPDFYYLNNYHHCEKTENLYNDMLFAMKSDIFKKFVEGIDIEDLRKNKKNSENHLYDFIKNNNVKTMELQSLGILRNDHQSYGWHLV